MTNLDIRTVSGGPIDVNAYVVSAKSAENCLIIDPGVEAQALLQAVDGRKVCAVLLTHAHFDHMLYAQHWLDQGAKLYVHRADADALGEPSINMSTMMRLKLVLPQADVLLSEGDVVREAGTELKVLHTPGHTPGSVCYCQDQIMFSGDTMFYRSYGRIDLPGGDGREMVASLTRLMQMDKEIVVYPGHGMKTKIAWERGNYA